MAGVEDRLLTFWHRYSMEFPCHGIYRAADRGEVSLATRTLPIYVHGDEGRGLKKTGNMILSFQGAIGQGSAPSNEMLAAHGVSPEGRMGLNLPGPSFNTRFLFASMQKKFYQKAPDARSFGLMFCCLGLSAVPL